MGSKRRNRPQAQAPSRGFSATSKSNPFAETWGRRAANAAARNVETRARLASRNQFADRRIGEDNPDLPEEDRYLARLQRARSSRATKRARFTLGDEDDDDLGDEPADALHMLTHRGSVLPVEDDTSQRPEKRARVSILKDDYDDGDDVLSVDNEEDGRVGPSGAGEGSLGTSASLGADDDLFKKRGASDSDEDGERRGRSHQEVMDEVMAKSKLHKADRQREKAEVDHETAELDSKLTGILELLATDSSAKGAEKESNPAVHPKSLFEASGNTGEIQRGPFSMKNTVQRGAVEDASRFDYEKVYIELATEKRARPTERTKTQEEIDVEERERLEELEKLRVRRMNSTECDSDGQEGRPKSFRSKKRKGHIGGDDLEDDFDLSILNGGEMSDEDDTMSASSSDSQDASDLSGNAGVQIHKKNGKEAEGRAYGEVASQWVKPAGEETHADDKLPFLYAKCPGTYEELSTAFNELSSRQRGVVVARIRACFAKSLNPPVNTPLLERFLRVLLKSVELAAEAACRDSCALVMSEVETLLSHVFELSMEFPQVLVSWARNRLEDAFTAVVEGQDEALSVCLTPARLILLRCISRLFPGSDLRHVIVTPLISLLGFCLTKVPQKAPIDHACACFTATVLLSLLAPAKRFSGDLVSFLQRALIDVGKRVSSGKAPMMRKAGHGSNGVLSFSDCFHDDSLRKRKEDHLLNLKILDALIGLAEAATFDGNLKCIRSSMAPVCEALGQCEERVATSTRDAIVALSSAEELGRKHLALFADKKSASVPKLLNPKFKSESGVYAGKQRGAGGAVYSDLESQRRLRQQVKKEARTASRELKRDAEAMNAVRERSSNEVNERREANSARLRSFMERQQHEAKLQSKKTAVGNVGLAAAGRKRKKW